MTAATTLVIGGPSHGVTFTVDAGPDMSLPAAINLVDEAGVVHAYPVERVAFGSAGEVLIARHPSITQANALHLLYLHIVKTLGGIAAAATYDIPDWRERTVWTFANGAVEAGRACASCGTAFRLCTRQREPACCHECSHDVRLITPPREGS